jgi:serine/threonine protein kinase/WD40 repeat protein
MTEPRHCPQCEIALLEDAPSGLCPNCLLKLALDSAADTLGLASGDKIRSLTAIDAISLSAPAGTIHFSGYDLIQEIARGGMGVVYKARQLSLNRTVAVKMMRPGLLATEDEIRRFRVEAEAVANLQHPNIVAIHEVGEQDGLHYFSMDYIEGHNLANLIAQHTLEASRAARYVKTIAEAVHYAHERGILHRDLKPSNILLDKLDRPHITDFGLAKRIDQDSSLTASGAVLGTPSYMSPEQAEGKGDQISPASDIYSLGAILYELTTGRPPFQAATPLDTIMLVLNKEPVSPRQLNPKLDRDLETICLKCLQKNPAQRYRSVRELAEDLGRYLNREPIEARPVSLPNRAMRWCRRNVWATVAASVAVVALFVVSLTTTFYAINYKNRLQQALFEQVRSERLAGNPAGSMKKIVEAAQFERGPELREEAIQAITTPGARALYQIPFGGHYKPVFSPDSRMLAVSGQYVSNESPSSSLPFGMEKVRVWEMDSGRPLAKTECDNNYGAFTFRPNTPLLAVSRTTHRTLKEGNRTSLVGIESRSIALWDPEKGGETARLELPAENTGGNSLFSNDGNYFVHGGYLLDLHNPGAGAKHMEGEPIAFLSNDSLLLKNGENIECYDANREKSSLCIPRGMKYFTASANGRIVILRSGDQSTDAMIVWDIAMKKEVGRIPVLEREAQVLVSVDGRLIALQYPTSPNLIELWEVTVLGFSKRLISIAPNTKILLRTRYSDDQAAFSPDGALFAAFVIEGGSGNLRIWDTQTCSQVAILRENHSPVWSGDSRLLATQGPGRIKLTDEKSHSATRVIENIEYGTSFVNVWQVIRPTPTYFLSEKITSLSFSPNGRRLASNGVIWEVINSQNGPQLLPSFKTAQSTYALFDNSGRLWVVDLPRIGSSNMLKFSQLDPEKQEITLKNSGYPDLNSSLRPTIAGEDLFGHPEQIDFSPDGRHLVAVCGLNKRLKEGGSISQGERTLELWDIDTQKRLAILNKDNLDDQTLSAKYSPDGKRIAIGGGLKEATIWDVATGKKVLEIDQRITSKTVTFSPDGKLLFSVSFSQADENESSNTQRPIGASRECHMGHGSLITVNDAETGREMGVWMGHTGNVNMLAVSPDGRWLASGGEDRTIRIWEVATGRELARWEAHQSEVTALIFSPDGNTLISGGMDGTLKLWNIPFIRQGLSSLGLDW